MRWKPLVLCLTIALATALARGAEPEKTRFTFEVGARSAGAGRIQLSPTTAYSGERGYGFEEPSGLKEVGGSITSDKPFFFSVKLPEGNYNVRLTLGSTTEESDTVVKAELRRLMLERVQSPPGRFETRTFTVNVRTPAIPGGDQVHLKTREKTEEARNWDDKLTLEFNGSHPSLHALEITRADDAPTLYLLGDSTVCDQPLEPWNSWGQMLPRFFKEGIAVANNAESGESLRSSLHANRLAKVLSTMKKGDYLFIQFGHNDMKEKGDGVGAFTTYKADLERFVTEARRHGGTPVLITSMNRKSFDKEGKQIVNTLKDYPDAVRAVAREMNVPLIDLHAMSKTLYEAIGRQNIDKAFQDGTHHNAYGSYELARCVVEGIKENKLDLVKFLADDAGNFDPAHPDPVEAFHIPPSPQHSARPTLGS